MSLSIILNQIDRFLQKEEIEFQKPYYVAFAPYYAYTIYILQQYNIQYNTVQTSQSWGQLSTSFSIFPEQLMEIVGTIINNNRNTFSDREGEHTEPCLLSQKGLQTCRVLKDLMERNIF